MEFDPPFCPFPECPSRAGARAFRFRRSGCYRRACDRRIVPRFVCRACARRFSAQTFRLDYRFRKPALDSWMLRLLVSKVTHRQAARMLRVNRKTVHRRLRRFAPALRALHLGVLARARRAGGLRGRYSLDELETFEHNRRLKPVTVPVLIEKTTHFVISARTAPLAARGRIGAREREKLRALEEREGRRRSGSKQAVEALLGELGGVHDPRADVEMATDGKRAYLAAMRRRFGNRRASHSMESSQKPRNRDNSLFAINHTLAMMRDQISRLVRRSWGASKCRAELQKHVWIWTAWKNYVRGITNEAPNTTPAMALLVARAQLSTADLLRWRWPDCMPDCAF